MRLEGTESWRISAGTAPPLVGCALWIRAAERLRISEDPLVPGPLDIDRPPPPISIADEVIALQWLGWWHSLVDPRGSKAPIDRALEPAMQTPDPLGLAPYPVLAAVVTRRWPHAQEWLAAREQRYAAASSDIGQIVRDAERALGRRARPFNLEFIVLPVRDDLIRRVNDERYLVPERVFQGPGWAPWLRALVTRIG